MLRDQDKEKRKRFPHAEESEAPEAATDSIQPTDEIVSTQSASFITQSAQAEYYDSQVEDIEGEPATQEPTKQSDEPARKKKLVRQDEQEEAMGDWLKDNTVLYDKGKKEYRDVDKKDTLWSAQGRLMGISGEFC